MPSPRAMPAQTFDIVETTIEDIHAAYKAGTLTARQLVQMYLDRIDAYDKKGPAINAIISLNPTALEEADRLDGTFKKAGFIGPLHGIFREGYPAGSRAPAPLEPVHCTPEASPSAGSPDRPSLHNRERCSPMKNRTREFYTSGSVRDEDGQPPHLLGRRTFLHLTAGAAILTAAPRAVWSQSYPTQPVRIIVGFPAGGGVDIITRLMGDWASKRLGQAFIVENRPGASGNIATEFVVRASADGYTLLVAVPGSAINSTFFEHLNFNFISDIEPVASMVRSPLIMVVNPSFPAKSVREFIAYAKANPGKLNYASPGVGSSLHLAGELFNMKAGIAMTHVPYKGVAPGLTDVLSGQVQVMFADGSSIEYVKAGKLRALAVTAATRSKLLPDVPTLDSYVPGYEATTWYGLGAPKNTPTEIINMLNSEINAGLADPGIQARFLELGYMPFVNSPAGFGKFIAEETEKWAEVIRAAHLKAE